jgi:hypothetical protein
MAIACDAAATARAADDFAVAPPLDAKSWADYLSPRDRRIAGRVLDPAGDPLPGATVWLASIINSRPVVEVQSDDQGRFELATTESVLLFVRSRDGRLEGGTRLPIWVNATVTRPVPEIELKLVERNRRNVKLQIRDDRGAPLRQTQLILHQQGWLDELAITNDQGDVVLPVRRDSEYWELLALKPGYGLASIGFGISQLGLSSSPFGKPQTVEEIDKQFHAWQANRPDPLVLTLVRSSAVRLRVVDQRGRAVPGLRVSASLQLPRKLADGVYRSAAGFALPELSQTTDEKGGAVFESFPPQGSAQFYVGVRPIYGPQVARFCLVEPLEWNAAQPADQLTLRVARLVSLRGHVRDSAGQPIAGATIRAAADTTETSTSSGEDGAYDVAVEPDHVYRLSASTPSGESLPREGIRVDFDSPVDNLELVVQPRAEVTFVGAEKVDDGQGVGRLECLVEQYQTLPLRAFDPHDNDRRWNVDHPHSTGYGLKTLPDGKLAGSFGPGTYAFFGRPWQEPISFRITDSQSRELVAVDPANWPGESTLKGVVLDLEGQPPARGAEVFIYPLGHTQTTQLWIRTDAEGKFQIRRPKVASLVKARLGRGDAVQWISAATERTELRARGFAHVRGRLVGLPPKPKPARWELRLAYPCIDVDSGQPLLVRRSPCLDGQPFTIEFVTLGFELELQISDDRQVWYTVGKFQPENPGTMELGDLVVDAKRIETAMNNRLAQAFAVGGGNNGNAISSALAIARQRDQNVLFVIGNPVGKLCQHFAHLLRIDRQLAADFQVVGLSVRPPFHPRAHEFVPLFDVNFAAAQRLVLAVASPDGQLLNRWNAEELLTGEDLDLAKIQAVLQSPGGPPHRTD